MPMQAKHLDQGIARETVANVALWVLTVTAIVPGIAALFALRAVTWGWSHRTGR